MAKFLITDTHFGVRNNSATWLKYQLEFFYKQFIPHLKRTPHSTVIHLGDVFDSRSSISPYIAQQVVQLFKDIKDVCDRVIIIGGNHDYYSPSTDAVTILDLLFDIPGLDLVTHAPQFSGEDAYIPWYEYEKLEEYIGAGYKNFFVHADIVTCPPKVAGVDIYSGHVHIPAKGKIKGGNLYNLGSVFALNFADCNASRGYYVLDKELQYIENQHSIRFWRLYNDEILEDPGYGKDDYIELYVDGPKMIESKFQKAIERFNANYKNVWVFPTSQPSEITSEDFKLDDLEGAIEMCIPSKLQKKFTKLKKIVHEKPA